MIKRAAFAGELGVCNPPLLNISHCLMVVFRKQRLWSGSHCRQAAVVLVVFGCLLDGLVLVWIKKWKSNIRLGADFPSG